LTEKEYMAELKAIKRQIRQGNYEESKKRLDALYSYKPVRLAWFDVKAKYLLKAENDPGAALHTLAGTRYTIAGMHHLYEDYPGFRECMRNKTDAYRMLGRDLEAIWTEYCCKRACGKNDSYPEKELMRIIDQYAEDTENVEILEALGKAYINAGDAVSYLIVSMALARKRSRRPESDSIFFNEFGNFGYLEERIRDTRSNTFILIMDEYQNRSLEILGNLLFSLGHDIYLFSPPLSFETKTQLELKETVAVSMEQMQTLPDMRIIPPVALTREGKCYGDNRRWLVDHICREKTQYNSAVVLCSGHLWETMYGGGELQGRADRLSTYYADYLEDKLQFGWAGDYLSYIGNLYGYDVRTEVYRTQEVDFSILVPAKNSTATLRYTLQTCLKQRYKGSYEIVVSDNSMDGDPDIRNLCEELDDPKLRYVKTPRNLSLAKSFEFGYLQTRGEFILSIGSDDGILPWALDTLSAILKRFPDEDIIMWDRGFYAWPGFNGGQQNQFVIPAKYSKTNISVSYMYAEQLLESLSRDAQFLYLLPLLYINSGFRRRYIPSLLEKTGKLWDGPNQDMNTGIINCLIFEKFLKIHYPITIAGMSSGSVGALSGGMLTGEEKSKLSDTRRRIFAMDNLGAYVHPRKGSLMCSEKYACDSLEIFRILSRCVLEGLCTQEQADKIIDWQAAAVRTLEQCGVARDPFDSLLFMGRYFAKEKGEGTIEWYQSIINGNNILTPRYVDENQMESNRQRKSYKEGQFDSGGECLDASRYGVTNISEAVELFVKRTGL